MTYSVRPRMLGKTGAVPAMDGSTENPVMNDILTPEVIRKALDDLWSGTGKCCSFCGQLKPPISYKGLTEILSGDM